MAGISLPKVPHRDHSQSSGLADWQVSLGPHAHSPPGLNAAFRRSKALTSTARRGNNLKNVTVDVPLGMFVAITGVSGGGKSTLDDRYHCIKALPAPLNGCPRGPCGA
jgi:ABC-type glutathione transport system ATPase component